MDVMTTSVTQEILTEDRYRPSKTNTGSVELPELPQQSTPTLTRSSAVNGRPPRSIMAKPAFLLIGFVLNTLDLVAWILTLGPLWSFLKLLASRPKIKRIADSPGAPPFLFSARMPPANLQVKPRSRPARACGGSSQPSPRASSSSSLYC